MRQDEEAPITEQPKKKKKRKAKPEQQLQAEQRTLHVSMPRGVSRIEVMEVFAEYGMKKVEVKSRANGTGQYALVQLKTEEGTQNALELDGTCPSEYRGQCIEVSEYRCRRQGKLQRYKQGQGRRREKRAAQAEGEEGGEGGKRKVKKGRRGGR